MLSHDEVTWAYRMLLGREPESQAVLQHYATQLGTRQALRALFMQSAEFRNALEQQPAARRPAVLGAPMQVELHAAPEQMAALFAKVSQQWHHLGDTEPHWSVITSQSYLQSQIGESVQAFYASGHTELAELRAALARAGLCGDRFGTCLELGCGVGRVTAALAPHCTQVWGVDISAPHLKHAADHMAAQGLQNVHLHQAKTVDDVVPVPAFDLLYTRIVLQHNPPPIMVRLLQQLLAHLSPGGVAYFQVPTYRQGYRFSIAEYLACDNTTGMEMHYLPQTALWQLLDQAGCTLLELREDDAIGASAQAVSHTVLARKRG